MERAVRRPAGDVGPLLTEGEPSLEGGEWAEAPLLWVGPDGDLLAGAALVGLGAADQHAEAAPGNGGDVTQRQACHLAAAERRAKAEQQQGAVTGAERGGGGGAGGEHQPEDVGSGGRSLLARTGAFVAGDALENHDEAGVAEVQRHAGEAVGGLDGGEVDAEAGDGEAAVGAADGIHGERLGVAGQRLAAEGGAPGLEGAPGRAVGAAGALAAGAGGIDGGPGRERLQRGGLVGAARAPEVAEQAGVQQQGLGRPGQGRGRVVVDAAVWPPFRPERGISGRNERALHEKTSAQRWVARLSHINQ